MVASGVSVLDALRLSSEVSANYYYERLWRHVLDAVTTGSRICESLRHNPLVPQTLVQMIGAGEEAGRLDRVLTRVSSHYDTEVENSIKTVTRLIEPLLIVVMGVVVGGNRPGAAPAHLLAQPGRVGLRGSLYAEGMFMCPAAAVNSS
jgi:type IV pilus assembly protein PilC